jgi:hypothetical protein
MGTSLSKSGPALSTMTAFTNTANTKDKGITPLSAPALMMLPAEIRLEVYKYIDPRHNLPSKYAGLCATCRQLRTEFDHEALKAIRRQYARRLPKLCCNTDPPRASHSHSRRVDHQRPHPAPEIPPRHLHVRAPPRLFFLAVAQDADRNLRSPETQQRCLTLLRPLLRYPSHHPLAIHVAAAAEQARKMDDTAPRELPAASGDLVHEDQARMAFHFQVHQLGYCLHVLYLCPSLISWCRPLRRCPSFSNACSRNCTLRRCPNRSNAWSHNCALKLAAQGCIMHLDSDSVLKRSNGVKSRLLKVVNK